MTPIIAKLGIVAGAGELPLQIARACAARGRQYHVLAIQEFAGPIPDSVLHTRSPISKLGASIRILKDQQCSEVVFAGKILRPKDQQISLRPDWGGVQFLLRNFGVLRKSNDGIHRAIANTLERNGFKVVSPLEAAPELGAHPGCLTKTLPTETMRSSFASALMAARYYGASGKGQAIIFDNDQVVATEQKAGTDAMLRAFANGGSRTAILVKAMSPNQLPTMDPPAIGESTVEIAASAGLAGILVETGRSIIVDPLRVMLRADELGLFVCGSTAGQ